MDRTLRAESLNDLAAVHLGMRDFRQALTYSEQALDLAAQIGGQMHVLALTGHGLVCQSLGAHRLAHEQHTRALHLARAFNHRKGEACAWNALGELCLLAGAPAQAVEHHRHALELLPGDSPEQARALNGIVQARQASGPGRSGRRLARQARV